VKNKSICFGGVCWRGSRWKRDLFILIILGQVLLVHYILVSVT